jgi:hypothetical protein
MRGQKAAARLVAEGELWPCQTNTIFGKIQVPQLLKHPKRELDQPRFPSESRGKFSGLVWDAICIPACPRANLSVLLHDEAKEDEQMLGQAFLAIVYGHDVPNRRGSEAGTWVCLPLHRSWTRIRPFLGLYYSTDSCRKADKA